MALPRLSQRPHTLSVQASTCMCCPNRRVLWHGQQTDLAVTVEEGMLHKWSISDQGATMEGTAMAGELVQLWSGALHPQDPSQCATSGGNNVQLWDMRSMACTGEVQRAHTMPVRDVCFSTGSGHHIISSGDDCKLKVWDLRTLGKSEAMLELGGHSHWVWKAQYSPFYEQLIASSSSDSLVNLYYTPQLAGGSRSEAAGGAGLGTADRWVALSEPHACRCIWAGL